jgi:hypothetical protein
MLIAWYDEVVDEMVEDGFLKIKTILGKVQDNGGAELHESALAYYKQYIYPKTEVEVHPVKTECKECRVEFMDLNGHGYCDEHLVERINGAGILELGDE